MKRGKILLGYLICVASIVVVSSTAHAIKKGASAKLLRGTYSGVCSARGQTGTTIIYSPVQLIINAAGGVSGAATKLFRSAAVRESTAVSLFGSVRGVKRIVASLGVRGVQARVSFQFKDGAVVSGQIFSTSGGNASADLFGELSYGQYQGTCALTRS